MKLSEYKLDMRTPIEIALDIDENGMTTARKLYSFLELANGQFSRWAKSNITENEFAEENVDYWGFDINVEGNTVQDYKLTAHFAKKLSCKGNSAKAEDAREYFTTLEEQVKQKVIDLTQLSPELQMFKSLWDMQAKQELEQKRQAEQIAQVETKVETMKEIFTKPISNWRDEINSSVRKISIKSGIEFQSMYNKMYRELECTAHCKLKTRCSNKEKTMRNAGKLKSVIKEETKIIAIIEEDPKLKIIFEDIVRRYEMSYCV